MLLEMKPSLCFNASYAIIKTKSPNSQLLSFQIVMFVQLKVIVLLNVSLLNFKFKGATLFNFVSDFSKSTVM